MQKTQKVAKIENREWGIVSKIQNTQARHTGEALDLLVLARALVFRRRFSVALRC